MCDDEDTEFLNLAAVCDAIHDFKTLYPQVKRSEDTILNGVKCSSHPDDIDEFIDNPEDKLLEKYIGYDSVQSIINDLTRSGYKKNIKIHSTDYSVRLLNIRRNGSIKINATKMLSQGINEDELINFLDDTNITLLLDAAFINVLKLLNSVEKRRLKVHHVINREVINDSAKSKGLSELDTINQLIDTDDNPIIYNKDSKFNTKYTLTLNKLTGTTTYFTIKSGDQLLYRSLNGTENTKQQCKKKFSQGAFKKDVIYQVKRSGDWLQALSCLDTRREYNTRNDNLNNIALITHDRVLLVYALFLGINVFFTSHDGELLYFKSLAINKNINEENSNEGSNSENSNEEANEENSGKEVSNKDNSSDEGSNKENSSDERKIWTLTRINFYNNLTNTQKRLLSIYRIEYPEPFETKQSMSDMGINLMISSFSRIELNKLTNFGFISYTLYLKIKESREKRDMNNNSQKGGNRTKILCENYIIELKDTIEAFDSAENPDYEYYENVSLIVLACLYEYKDSKDVYEIIQSIVFDILPSIEKKIETKEQDVIQFFGEDKYVADCTSFAARNIALHSLGLRTGSIENLGNREKYGVNIPITAVDTFIKMKTTLPPGFEERQAIIMNELQKYHGISKNLNNTRKRGRNNKINNNMYGYTKRLREQVAVPAMGGRKTYKKNRKSRRKSRK